MTGSSDATSPVERLEVAFESHGIRLVGTLLPAAAPPHPAWGATQAWHYRVEAAKIFMRRGSAEELCQRLLLAAGFGDLGLA